MGFLGRVFSLFLAFVFCTSSAAAWTADSFVGRLSNEVYSFEPPASKAPGLMSTAPAAEGDASNSGTFDISKGVVIPYYGLDGTSNSRWTFGLRGRGKTSLPGSGGSWQPITTEFMGGSVRDIPVFAEDSSFSYNYIYGVNNGTLSYDGSSFDNVKWLDWVATSFAVDFSQSFPDAPQTVQVDFTFPNCGRYCRVNGSAHYFSGNIGHVEFLVNSNVMASVPFSFGTAGIVFSMSKTFTVPAGIRNVVVRFVFDTVYWADALPTSDTGSVSYRNLWYFAKNSNIRWSSLSGAPVLDGWNDEAQGNINEHEKYESQWAGTMTDNFNKLDLSNFKFPVPLVSGFALISGIFTDIWNAMGEYRVVYVFPLTLAIVLLLVGRISKFGGSQSSSKKKGDGDA